MISRSVLCVAAWSRMRLLKPRPLIYPLGKVFSFFLVWAVATPVKYECDIEWVTSVVTKVKNLETNGTEKIGLVTPSPASSQANVFYPCGVLRLLSISNKSIQTGWFYCTTQDKHRLKSNYTQSCSMTESIRNVWTSIWPPVPAIFLIDVRLLNRIVRTDFTWEPHFGTHIWWWLFPKELRKYTHSSPVRVRYGVLLLISKSAWSQRIKCWSSVLLQKYVLDYLYGELEGHFYGICIGMIVKDNSNASEPI